MELHARGQRLQFPRRPLIMGIVNLNDDSFCGDGTLDPSLALQQARQMALDGADVIDAGAESARTNRPPVSIGEETARFARFVPLWLDWCHSVKDQPPPFDSSQVWPPWLSLNTWRPEVVSRVLPMGGHLLNDIGALPDDSNARLCAEHGAALLVMHSIGRPKEKQTHIVWPDIMGELERFFAEKIAVCRAAGLPENAIVLDPGIDFAKQKPDNLAILRESRRLQQFGRPVLLPISRKTVIGDVLNQPDPSARDAGTLACIASGITRGAQILRVHAVKPAAEAVKVLWAICSAGA